jgi:hypothetical protein
MKLKTINKIFKLLINRSRYRNWKEILADIENKPTRVVLSNGLDIQCPKENSIMRALNRCFFARSYNPKNFTIDSNDIVLDIGANIGVFTLYAASQTSKAVYAFEPVPKSYEYLKKNVATNNLKHVKTYQTAVCDHNLGEGLRDPSINCDMYPVLTSNL